MEPSVITHGFGRSLIPGMIKVKMLKLNDPRWRELNNAYGSATNTPQLLVQLEVFLPEMAITNFGSLCGVR